MGNGKREKLKRVKVGLLQARVFGDIVLRKCARVLWLGLEETAWHKLCSAPRAENSDASLALACIYVAGCLTPPILRLHLSLYQVQNRAERKVRAGVEPFHSSRGRGHAGSRCKAEAPRGPLALASPGPRDGTQYNGWWL